MKPIAIFGTGGHARAVVDVLDALDLAPEIFMADSPTEEIFMERAVLRKDELFPQRDFMEQFAFIVAIGNNRARMGIHYQILDHGGEIAEPVIHPLAYVGQKSKIYDGCVIMPGAIIGPNCTLGESCIVNNGATIAHDSSIGPFCNISDGCTLGGTVSLHAGAFAGLNSTILPNKRMGEWSTLGASATLIHDMPAGETWVGTPARPIA